MSMKPLMSLLIALTLAACTAATPDNDRSQPESASASQPAPPIAANTPQPTSQPAPVAIQPSTPQEEVLPRRKPAPPKSRPLPPERESDAAKRVEVDMSCKTDADCTVKNVGNCCGYYPACVNRNSPTDPAGVQANCAKQGMASVCGWAEISSCSCVQGRCAGNNTGAAAQ